MKKYLRIAVFLALVLPMCGRSVGARTAASNSLLPFKPQTALEQEWHAAYTRAYQLDRERRYLEAAAAFSSSLPLARRAGCVSCELRTLSNIGGDLLAARQYKEALETMLDARRLAVRVGDRQMAGVLSLNLSNLYLHRFALSEAVGAAEEAHQLLDGTEQPWLRSRLSLHRARLASRRGRMPEAERIYRTAIRDAAQRGDSALQAMAWEHLGLEQYRQRDLKAAEQALNESFRLRKMTNDPALGASHLSLSYLLSARGDHESALRMAAAARGEWLARPQHFPWWQTALARGRALAGLGRAREAIGELDAAIEQIRAERIELLPADSLRVSHGAGTYEAYAARIELGVETALTAGGDGLVEESFQLVEEARAQTLRQWSGEWEAARRRLPPAHARALEELQAARAKLVRGGSGGEAEVERIQRRLTEMEAEAGMRRPATPGVADFRRSMLAGDEALLSFYLGQRRAYVWAATREALRVYRLPDREWVAKSVAAFSSAVQAGKPAGEPGRELYRALLAGAAGQIRSKRRWMLSLDGDLLDLPFAALLPEPGVYLAERHSITLVPGSWALTAVSGARWDGGLIALGDPIYNTADPRWRGAANVPADGQLARLPGSGREIRNCAREFGDPAAPLLEGPDATLGRLQAEAERRRPAAIHLATHFVAMPQGQPQIAMALSLESDGTPRLAGPEQIAALGLAARLVVLSGCGSGGGPTREGEGRVGIARAWLLGGAQSVMATYWPTTDSSGQMIQEFYSFWRSREASVAKIHPGDALQKAQIQMIQRGSWYAEPRNWASHFLITKS